MKSILPALLVGLVAGAGSAFVTVKAMGPGTASTQTAPVAVQDGEDDDLAARLALLERWQADQAVPLLTGRVADASPSDSGLDAEALAALKKDMLEAMQASLPES